jgi:hypothetical protein
MTRPPPRDRPRHVRRRAVLYGGAAGGGKSRFAAPNSLALCLEVPLASAASSSASLPRPQPRRRHDPRARSEVPRELATYNAGDHIWTLRNGSTIELGYLGRDADVTSTRAPSTAHRVRRAHPILEFRYRYLLSRLRVSGHVREYRERPRPPPPSSPPPTPAESATDGSRAGSSTPAPGRCVAAAPTLEDPKPGTRVFIPAKVTDNPHIDASYIDRLNGLPDDQRRALRDGDWDVYQASGSALPPRHSRHRPRGAPPPPRRASSAASASTTASTPRSPPYGAPSSPTASSSSTASSTRPASPPPSRPRLILDAEPRVSATRAAGPSRSRSTRRRGPGTRTSRQGRRINPRRPLRRPPEGSIAAAYRDCPRHAMSTRPATTASPASPRRRQAPRPRRRPPPAPRLLDVPQPHPHPADPAPRQKRPEDVDTHAEDHAYDALRYLLMDLEGNGPPVTDSSPIPSAATRYVTHRPDGPVTGRLSTTGF